MTKNFSTQLARQIGESLVVAELGKRRILATPFAGNVPDIDILAYGSQRGRSLALQVKTMRRGSISVNVENYLDMEFEGERQIIKGKKSHLNDLIFVAIWLADESKPDNRYYICTKKDITDIVETTHRNFLDGHGGIRPRNPKSLHSGIRETKLEKYRDNWDLIRSKLGEPS